MKHTIKGKLGRKMFELTELAKTANLKTMMEEFTACSLTTSSYFGIQSKGSFFSERDLDDVVINVLVDVVTSSIDDSCVLASGTPISTSTIMLWLSLLFLASLIARSYCICLLAMRFLGLCK